VRQRFEKGLASVDRNTLVIDGFVAAAVLVPLIERGDRISVGYTLRPNDMPTHGGQISFPGGRCEPEDADLAATAMRESHEELGISPDHVHVMGAIDDVPTPVGFVITPVVGWLSDPPEFVIDEREVHEYFEVELDELRDPANYRHRGERDIAGIAYPVPEFHVAGRLIWGATARITERLLEIADLR
jgi:8-oxo-dGTP pyrophosphatase MutT (NUDIX family)